MKHRVVQYQNSAASRGASHAVQHQIVQHQKSATSHSETLK